MPLVPNAAVENFRPSWRAAQVNGRFPVRSAVSASIFDAHFRVYPQARKAAIAASNTLMSARSVNDVIKSVSSPSAAICCAMVWIWMNLWAGGILAISQKRFRSLASSPYGLKEGCQIVQCGI